MDLSFRADVNMMLQCLPQFMMTLSPLRRYCRFDFLELADFIIQGYHNSEEPKSRNALRESFDFIDSSYDHKSLREALNRELETRGFPPAYDS